MPNDQYSNGTKTGYFRQCITDIRSQVTGLAIQHASLQATLAETQTHIIQMHKEHKEDRKEIYDNISNLRKNVAEINTKLASFQSADTVKDRHREKWSSRLWNLFVGVLIVVLTAAGTWFVATNKVP